MYGGIRFGGTLSIDDAWALGFDHVAIAAGAGKPTIVDMKNNLLRGIRQASDFLMALQLTGAFKREALANLQVRLPAVVDRRRPDGHRHRHRGDGVLPAAGREDRSIATRRCARDSARRACAACFDAEELRLLDEFLAHGRAVRAERARAAAARRARRTSSRSCERWGGVSLVYRKGMLDSPAYRLNHEEITKSLEEGIRFVERMNPEEAVPDEFGARQGRAVPRADQRGRQVARRRARSSRCRRAPCSSPPARRPTSPTSGSTPARSSSTTSSGSSSRTSSSAAADGALAPRAGAAKGFFTSYKRDGRFVSYYGDNHPTYAGNVVKAMASATRRLSATSSSCSPASSRPRRRRRAAGARRGVGGARGRASTTTSSPASSAVTRLTPTIVEVVVRAPAAARHFQPGPVLPAAELRDAVAACSARTPTGRAC